MSLKDEIQAEVVKAAKARDKVRLSTLRFLMSGIKNKEIELKRALNDDETQQVIASLLRRGKESMRQFKEGGRQDLVDKEAREVSVLESFMPAQLSKDEVVSIVSGIVEKEGASGIRDMGKVMNAVMPLVKGKVEGKLVNEVVKEQLGAL